MLIVIFNVVLAQKYCLKGMYIVVSNLQLHISTLEIDVHVAFPVADFISLAVVLGPFLTANRNVIIATIVRAMVQRFQEGLKASVYWQLCLQYAQVDVLIILKEMLGHYLLMKHVSRRRMIWVVAISRKNKVFMLFRDTITSE